MSSQTTTSFKILMLPWLAHGHIFPYLELSKRILTRKNFHIYFCSTAINSTSINSFIHKNSLQNSIEFIELHLQADPDQLPPQYHTTKNLPSAFLPALLSAFQTAHNSFSHILTSLTPDLVIFDIFQPWAASSAKLNNIPAVHFASYGAALMSYIHHHYVDVDTGHIFPSQEFRLNQSQKRNVDEFIEFMSGNVFGHDRDVIFVNYRLSSEVVLLKTSCGFEGKYLDYLGESFDKRIMGVGPLVTDSWDDDLEGLEVLEWLDKKAHHSVVYISFGSEFFLSKEEIEEIARGVEVCGVSFIWIIRFPLGDSPMALEEALPTGFLDRVHDHGVVMSGWAPQARILGHPSTGAFASHCGWSSVMESIYFGVPIIGMPMKLDQHINAKMVAEGGACVEVPMAEKDGMYKGEEIGKAMRKAVNGEGLRQRARELSEKMRLEEEQAMDVVADQLWRLCVMESMSS